MIDLMLYQREAARGVRDWRESDRLRDELLGLGVIVTDTKDGQEAVLLAKGITAAQYIERQERGKRAEARFDAWLFSMNKSIGK